jgi:hypothetical protein
MSSPFARLRPYASVLLVLFAFTSIGCYPARPITTLSPDRDVVLTLTDAGIVDMAPRLGQGVFLVGGHITRIDSTSVVLAVSSTQSTLDVHEYEPHHGVVEWGGDLVTIPTVDIAIAHERNNAGLVIGIVGGALLLTSGIIGFVLATRSHALPKLPTLPPLTPPVI